MADSKITKWIIHFHSSSLTQVRFFWLLLLTKEISCVNSCLNFILLNLTRIASIPPLNKVFLANCATSRWLLSSNLTCANPGTQWFSGAKIMTIHVPMSEWVWWDQCPITGGREWRLRNYWNVSGDRQKNVGYSWLSGSVLVMSWDDKDRERQNSERERGWEKADCSAERGWTQALDRWPVCAQLRTNRIRFHV